MGLVVTKGNPLGNDFVQRGIHLPTGCSQPGRGPGAAPKTGDRVVDLAAAPGGKSFSLLSWEADLQVFAGDKSWRRLRLLQENRNRLGLQIELVQADTLRPPFRASFDRVILDVPCTGTGTLRKNPELKWRINAGEIERLADQGLGMLEAGSRLVRSGGVLTMMTCSLEPEENVDVVSRFLATHSDFELMPLRPGLPTMLEEWVIDAGGWQILPAGVHDGFTVHALRCRR